MCEIALEGQSTGPPQLDNLLPKLDWYGGLVLAIVDSFLPKHEISTKAGQL